MNIERVSAMDTKTQEDGLIVVLKFKKWLAVYGMLAILCVMCFMSFGTIVPYLMTGDVAAIWPAHHGGVAKKALFLLATPFFWLSLPALAPNFRVGDIFFFETHMEVRPYLGFLNTRTVSYNVMHVKQRGNRGMVITNGGVPEWRLNIYDYWKAIYWESIIVPMFSMGLSNPECLPRALEIVRNRAITITKF